MNRTTRFKLLYLLELLVLSAAVVGIVWWLGWSMPVMFVLGILLLAPGRIQAYYYRDLFLGRRLMAAGDLEGAIQHTERFLTTIRQRPGLKRLIWLAGVVYTSDPEAMALNNLGATRLESGDLEAAETRFQEAIVLDSLYGMPYYNLAVLSEASGDRVSAEKNLGKAAELGYRRNGLDMVIHQAGTLLSKIEGRGAHYTSAR